MLLNSPYQGPRANFGNLTSLLCVVSQANVTFATLNDEKGEIEKIKKTMNKSLKIARPVSAYAFFNGRLFKTDTLRVT